MYHTEDNKARPIISISGLSHRYNINWAINDINFDINKKGVLGLLGSNGAGKSTTMNIMCGVLKQTAGTVTIDGIDLGENPQEAKRQIGFLPQTPPLHMDLTVDEYLIHCAYLRQIDRKAISAALESAKVRCGIANFSKRLIRSLSGGYRQRVGIAQAIIHTPKLVVLDEPTNGLDPVQIYEVRNLIKDIASERAVIFSSHILSEIQATCQDIVMIEGGKIVFKDTMEAFNNYSRPNSLMATFDKIPDIGMLKSIEDVDTVETIGIHQVRLAFRKAGAVSERVIAESQANGWGLQEIQYEKNSLDEVFAQLSGRIINRTANQEKTQL